MEEEARDLLFVPLGERLTVIEKREVTSVTSYAGFQRGVLQSAGLGLPPTFLSVMQIGAI